MSEVDLSALTIDASNAVVPKRPIGPRLLIIAVIGLAIGLAATFLWPILFPARPVRLAAVSSVQQAGSVSTSATAEAVGWVEADPYPIIVRPLVSGHVDALMVLEGAVVEKNKTVIATLASAELRSAKERAHAAVAVQQAALKHAQANQQLASNRLEQNAETRLRVRDAEVKLAGIQTQVDTARRRLHEATANAEGAIANVKAQERLAEAGNSYPVALDRARAEADAATAGIEAAEATVNGLQRERDSQRDTLKLCEELAAEPVDLQGDAAIAEAEVQKATSALDKAKTDLAIAERELEWATVLAPIDGVVLRLEAEPGDMVGHGATGVVALYDPKKLRARIDVPLDSIGGVREGQQVEVTSEATGKTIVRGVVQRLQHETDLLKNTLQVKIGLFDPPPLLRPETLCRARFLASADAPSSSKLTAFRVPAAAVQDGQVFVFDPKNGTARSITIEVLSEDGDARIVRGELSPTHHVVLDPVTDGERIQEQTR